jgi:hypothetical protein
MPAIPEDQAMDDDVKVATQDSPAMHSQVEVNIDGYSDQGDIKVYLGPVVAAFDEAYQGLISVHTAREASKRNPTWNEAQQQIETQAFADKVYDRVTKTFSRTEDNLRREIVNLTQDLNAPVTARASASISAEIRAHVKALPVVSDSKSNTVSRLSFVMNAIKNGDHDSVTAVLGAPAFLSGLDSEMQQQLLAHYHATREPQKARRLKAMQTAWDLFNGKLDLIAKQLEKAVGAPKARVEELRRKQAESTKAFQGS